MSVSDDEFDVFGDQAAVLDAFLATEVEKEKVLNAAGIESFDDLTNGLSADQLFAEDDEFLGESFKAFKDCLRFKVETVQDVEPGRRKTLRCRLERPKEHTMEIQLWDDWATTRVETGEILNVILTHDLPCSLTSLDITTDAHYIIVHPDLLISGTVIADSFTCTRRSVISHQIKTPLDRSPHLLYGSLLHELFQSCLISQRWDSEFIFAEARRMVGEHLEDLFNVDENESGVWERVREIIPKFQEFANKFMHHSIPKANATVIQHRGGYGQAPESISVSQLIDIEENIWTPTYGMKGKIDATIQVRMRDGKSGQYQEYLAPFELKTGKSIENLSHRAQTALYTLMMSDRYKMFIDFGLLYYCKTGDIIKVKAMHDEIRGLLIQRNKLASFLSVKTGLPEMLGNSRICSRCHLLDSCSLLHKALENGTCETSGLGALFETKTSHLSAQHVEFFKKWNTLLTLEETNLSKFRKEIWLLSGPERENVGRCFSNVGILEELDSGLTGSKIGSFRYRMGRASGERTSTFLESQITEGDCIVVSTEDGQYALAIGFIREITAHSFVIATDRILHKSPQNFVKYYNRKQSSLSEQEQDKKQLIYRVDRDEMVSGMGLARFNMTQLFLTDPSSLRLCSLIVDLKPPSFEPNLDFEKQWGSTIDSDPTLNRDQRQAIRKVVEANDYTLILGMPGTGKTHTIAKLISMLQKFGKSVLVTSYTHSALDNILMKLKDLNVNFLRVGNIDKVHPELREFTSEKLEYSAKSLSQLETLYLQSSIIGTTCLGVNHPLFFKRKFDYCIVDEAAQITLPVCLGPLRCAEKFVLVGDHYQLPPVVQNPVARQEGLAVSLFQMLCENHPHSVSSLCLQYRMNREIMDLSNHLTYDSRLQCGSLEAGDQQLHISLNNRTPCWIRSVFDSNKSVVFLDTSHLSNGYETKSGDLLHNAVESNICNELIRELLKSQVSARDIGVISQYRAQLKHISHSIADKSVECMTVDKFQGRDKKCIIMSFVRSNDEGKVGDLLKDDRRLNVAVTRAKAKLILIGSIKTLKNLPLYDKLSVYLESKARVICLKDADFAGSNDENLLLDQPHHGKRQRILHNVDTVAASKVLRTNYIIANIFDASN